MRMLVTEAPGMDESSVRRSGDVGGRDLARTRLAQVGGDGLVALAGDDQLLDVEDDLGDILLDTRNGAELVQHAVDADAGDGCTGDRRQEAAAQRVSDRVTEAGLQGLDDEPAAELPDLLLGQGGTLCDEHYGSFRLSARYMTLASWMRCGVVIGMPRRFDKLSDQASIRHA